MTDNKEIKDKLVNCIEWIKSKPFWILPFLILLFLSCMLFVRIGYWLGFSLFTISYENSLLFLGSFLAFIGTVFLGVVSYVQNSNLTNENKRLQKELQDEKIMADENMQKAKIESEQKLIELRFEWEIRKKKEREQVWYKTIKALISAYSKLLNHKNEGDKFIWLDTYLKSELFYDYNTAYAVLGDDIFDKYYEQVHHNILNTSKKKQLSRLINTNMCSINDELYSVTIKSDINTIECFELIFDIKKKHDELIDIKSKIDDEKVVN